MRILPLLLLLALGACTTAPERVSARCQAAIGPMPANATSAMVAARADAYHRCYEQGIAQERRYWGAVAGAFDDDAAVGNQITVQGRLSQRALAPMTVASPTPSASMPSGAWDGIVSQSRSQSRTPLPVPPSLAPAFPAPFGPAPSPPPYVPYPTVDTP